MNDCGCSSEISADDERQPIWAKQRAERGFDNTELWNLDVSIARFVLPRLKAFAEDLHGYPADLTEETWKAELNKMIAAFELSTEVFSPTDEQSVAIEAGLDSFREHFHSLWS